MRTGRMFPERWAGLVVVVLVGLLAGQDARAGQANPAAEVLAGKLVGLIGAADAAAVAAPDGTLLWAAHADQMRVPASILKVLTALAAIHYLGADYRYPTDFFWDNEKNLKIKGYGDPLLVSEKVRTVAGLLAGRVDTINNLIVDDSYFETPILITGRGSSNEPYDAPNGALCVNFNTVFFMRRNGRWISAEEQTPLLPSILPKIKASGLTEGRITLAGDTAEGVVYAGELFHYFLSQAGIRIQGNIQRGTADPRRFNLLLRHEADERLTDIISSLMEFSNNFIANQLMLTMGAKAYGPPATVAKGVRALQSYYSDVLGITGGQIAEASGISRQNRISARIMLHLLTHFRPYHQLMRGKDGWHWYKTGHLNGVRTQAGYLVGRDGQLYSYAVMVNTPGKTVQRIVAGIEGGLR